MVLVTQKQKFLSFSIQKWRPCNNRKWKRCVGQKFPMICSSFYQFIKIFIIVNHSFGLIYVQNEEQEEGQQEGGISSFHHVAELEAHGISHQDCQKLADAGFCTVESIANATVRKLSEVKGISEV